jgi:uncharacterized damage-inducible protein DinB
MNYAELMLPEFDEEMANTRKVLALIPDDKFDWKAHPKLNTIGWNANHLAETPGWVEGILLHDNWDIAPVGGEPYRSPQCTSKKEILDFFDRNVAAGRRAIPKLKDADIGKPWSLLQAGQPILTMPRWAVYRNFIINHTVHHRAHLLVYLRLNDIPVPGMYGPSGDEPAA